MYRQLLTSPLIKIVAILEGIHSKENIMRLIGGNILIALLKVLSENEAATQDLQERIIELQP
jgi:hypothetical protein